MVRDVVCVCVFFFFKQKTAYEMRISDWSSDVCSSDLAPDSARAAEKGRSPAATVACRQRFGSKIATGGNLQPLLSLLAHGKPRRKQDERQRQIGRASCRERVCQYV